MNLNVTGELGKVITRLQDISNEYRNLEASELQQKLDGLLAEVECFVDDLIRQTNNAREVYEDAKREGLTTTAIEAEGFLRAFLTIKGDIKFNEGVFAEILQREEYRLK